MRPMSADADSNQSRSSLLDTVCIPGGLALVGTDRPVFPGDGESPLREQEIASFRITPTAVSNRQFARFVNDTGYVTEAERYGWSFVYRGALAHTKHVEDHVLGLLWWCRVKRASWFDPKGPESSTVDFDHLPVVHVSFNDAAAFAMWAGGRLPSEAEWEHAARGGLLDVKYPWGDDEPDAADPRCHFGQIGSTQLTPDQVGPVAVGSFSPNGYGLYNMVGNIWEWTTTNGEDRDEYKTTLVPRKILKGGSYLCHPRSCFRYRIAARISNTIDTSIGHTGFRIVFT